MARTEKEIQEQIDKLEAARKVTQARNGYAHYTERIAYLKGEILLLRERNRQAGHQTHEQVCRDSWDKWAELLGLPSAAECDAATKGEM